jgi:membrane-associated HD superfamily phosphohydrolase
MAKDYQTKSSRVESLTRSVRSRRQDFAERLLNQDGLTERVLGSLMATNTGAAILVVIGFAVVCSAMITWTRAQPLVAVGRVMNETRLVRTKMTIEDQALTVRAKEAQRQRTPRVYVADSSVIDGLTQSIENLPKALASVDALSAVDPSIRLPFNLTDPLLAAVKAEAVEGNSSAAWISKVRTLGSLLRLRPLLDNQTYQKSVQEGTNQSVKLLVGGVEPQIVSRSQVANVGDKALAEVAGLLARDAGFAGPARDLVVNRLLFEPRPTFAYDEAATTKDLNSAADAIKPVMFEIPVGQVI